jgi:hypothetical protein
MGKSELVMYQPDSTVAVEVRLENENVWLNRQQIAVLFDRDIKTIGKHINNALNEELAVFSTVAKFATVGEKKGENSVVANFATTAVDGKVYQVEYYNLDVILSVGYRVKSNRGVQFRIWANRVLKNYLMKGYAVNKRFERLENRVTKTEKKIDFFVKNALPPIQGIFYEGEIFDAYIFVSKHEPININTSNNYHDRFLVIDNTVYFIGASLKDLGKKLFAFSKMEIKPTELLSV